MKILCLSDIHIHPGNQKEKINRYRSICIAEDPDIVLVTGDIFEHNIISNPYKVLADVFAGSTVICCLGNHEFYHRRIPEVMNVYQINYEPTKYDVHYLDVIDKYDVGDYRFLGNVLWYDGSLSTIKNQKLLNFADFTWNDMTIKDFDPVKENKLCIEKIKTSYDSTKKNILVTHCVPHKLLNGWYENSTAPVYNAFSGVIDLFEQIKPIHFDYAVCGHTHKRRVGIEINGCKCINTGNDYNGLILYYILEI